jgi:hypothetical protein
MSGNGKHMLEYSWFTAYQTAKYGLVEFDKEISMGTQTITRVDIEPSSLPSPEDIAIKNSAFRALSTESRQIVKLILEAPQEILDCLKAPKYNKISKRNIFVFLRSEGWTRQEIQTCFKELKTFCSEIL